MRTALFIAGLALIATASQVATADTPAKVTKSWSELTPAEKARIGAGAKQLEYNALRDTGLSGAWQVAAPEMPSIEKSLAPGQSQHPLSVRINSLDVVNQRILPELARRAGLDHLQIADQKVLEGDANGYHYTATLRQIAVHLSLDPPNSLITQFAPGNLVLMNVDLPQAQGMTVLHVEAVSPHWYEPNVSDDFPITVQAFKGHGSMGLQAKDGVLSATSFDFSQLNVGSVHVDNLGVLGDILNTVLGHTDLCGDGCHSVDEWVTQTVNRLLRNFVAEKLAGPVKDSLLAELTASAQATLVPDGVGVSTQLTITGLETQGETAITHWNAVLTSLLPDDPCASGLVMNPAAPHAPFEFDTNTRSGDFEVALPVSALHDTLYRIGREGKVCSASDAKIWKFPYHVTAVPYDQVQVQADSDRNTMTALVPVRFDLESPAHHFFKISSKNVQGVLQLTYRPLVDSEQGLYLRLESAELTNLVGEIKILGIPIQVKLFAKQFEAALQAQLEATAGRIPVLHRVVPINDLVSLELGDLVRIYPEYIWSSFSISSTGDQAALASGSP